MSYFSSIAFYLFSTGSSKWLFVSALSWIKHNLMGCFSFLSTRKSQKKEKKKKDAKDEIDNSFAELGG